MSRSGSASKRKGSVAQHGSNKEVHKAALEALEVMHELTRTLTLTLTLTLTRTLIGAPSLQGRARSVLPQKHSHPPFPLTLTLTTDPNH